MSTPPPPVTRFRFITCGACGDDFLFEVVPGRPRALCDGCQT